MDPAEIGSTLCYPVPALSEVEGSSVLKVLFLTRPRALAESQATSKAIAPSG
jgi:hypothetical protein